jgi:hypothetical protein
MAIVSVEVPDYIKKSIWNQKKISFFVLYNKMEKENWIDIPLEEHMEMEDFYNVLSKEL